MSLEEKVRVALVEISRGVGEQMVEYGGQMRKQDFCGDPKMIEKGFDRIAYESAIIMIKKYLPEFHGQVVSEYRGDSVEEIVSKGEERIPGMIVLDEIDGSSGYSAWVVDKAPDGPNCSVSIAFLDGETIGSIVAGAVYDMGTKISLSGARKKDGYVAYHNGDVIRQNGNGNSVWRITVADYSTRSQEEIGRIRQAIVDRSTDACTMKVYGGEHPTSLDICKTMVSQRRRHAYVDVRALLDGTKLRKYDVMGSIPIAKGAGLSVTDAYGEDLEDQPAGDNGPLSVVIGPEGLTKDICEAMRPVLPDIRASRLA